MSRPRGGYIGHTVAPAASTGNSAAAGVWTLREAEALKRAGTWPRSVPPGAILAVTFDSGYTDFAQGLTASETSSGVSLSSAQFKGAAQSLLVRTATTLNNTTTSRITYGSGSQWDITGADFTVECWVYSTADGLYQGMVCRDNQGDRRNWQFLKLSGAEGNVATFSIFNSAVGTFLSVTDSAALPTNQWVHMAAVRDSGVLRLYRNGVQRASANFSSASGTRSTASGPLAVGAINENGNFCWCGYIDEVLVSTVCRYPNGTTFTPQDGL
jgi:hypothetical protein